MNAISNIIIFRNPAWEGFKWIAYIFALMTDVDYPQSPKEWKSWIWNMLNISEEEGIRLFEQENFPFDKLFEVWNREFSTEHGYSPHFIPALSRNVKGFVSWIYGNGPEPNWMKSDAQSHSTNSHSLKHQGHHW